NRIATASLDDGAIRPALMPEKWPDLKGTRRTGYDRLCRHVLLFFDATLKQQAAARASLERSVRGEGLDDGFRLKFKPAAPVRPTNPQIANYLKQHGVEKTVEFVRANADRPLARLGAAPNMLLPNGDTTAAPPALRLAIR